MEALKCPNCQAPANPAPGQAMYTCTYCGQAFNTGLQPPPPPTTGQQPMFIVIGPSEDHSYHPVPHVPVQVVGSGLSYLVWIVVVLIIAGGAGGFTAFTRCSSIASSMIWDGSEPFSCGGNDDVSVKGVKATFTAGTAINVSGNCHFTCTDCTIKAPIAIEAGGNGSVTIINGSIVGTSVLADAGGNAHVNISGNATSSGLVRQSANARVSGAMTAPPPVVPVPAAPTVPAVPAAAPKPAAKPTPGHR